jgi:hypothetical protein
VHDVNKTRAQLKRQVCPPVRPQFIFDTTHHVSTEFGSGSLTLLPAGGTAFSKVCVKPGEDWVFQWSWGYTRGSAATGRVCHDGQVSADEPGQECLKTTGWGGLLKRLPSSLPEHTPKSKPSPPGRGWAWGWPHPEKITLRRPKKGSQCQTYRAVELKKNTLTCVSWI